MLLHQLSLDKYKALSLGLNHHISPKGDPVLICTQFACCYQNIVHNIENQSDDPKCKLTTNLRSACKKYNRVKVSFRYSKVSYKVSNDNNITLLYQDKGRVTVVTDRKRYAEKCLDVINIKRFCKLDNDPTKIKSSKNCQKSKK